MTPQPKPEDILLVRLYVEEKLSINQIAERTGLGWNFVRGHLLALGVELRNPRRPDISDEEIRRLYVEEALSLRKVGERLGITNESVLARLKKMGVPRRPPHRH